MRVGERSGAALARVAACISMLLPLPATMTAQRIKPKACTGFDLSPMADVKDAKGRPIFLDVPQIVKSGKNILVFSNNTMLWLSEHVFADTVGMLNDFKAGRYIDQDTLGGAALSEKGIATTFGKPNGVKKMIGMVAASDGAVGAWVAWLAASDSTKPPTELWTGHFEDGRWDAVSRIYEGLFISKVSLSIAGGVRTAPQIAIASDFGMKATDPRGIAVFKRVRDGWQVRWTNTGLWSPMFSEIARVSARRLLVAYVGSRTPIGTHGDTNQVWVSHSDDDGDTWSEYESVGNVWNYRGNWLEIRAFDDRDVHMMWMKDRAEDSTVEIFTIRSIDGGKTWQEARTVTLPRLRYTTTFAYKEGFDIIAGDELDSLALVELRNDAPPTSKRLPWQGRTLPARVATFGETNPAFVLWGRLVNGSYPLFPNLGVPASSYSWFRPCLR